jgi:hypothetical protein
MIKEEAEFLNGMRERGLDVGLAASTEVIAAVKQDLCDHLRVVNGHIPSVHPFKDTTHQENGKPS